MVRFGWGAVEMGLSGSRRSVSTGDAPCFKTWVSNLLAFLSCAE